MCGRAGGFRAHSCPPRLQSKDDSASCLMIHQATKRVEVVQLRTMPQLDGDISCAMSTVLAGFGVAADHATAPALAAASSLKKAIAAFLRLKKLVTSTTKNVKNV